jgi:DnaJ-class molecular chaperone
MKQKVSDEDHEFYPNLRTELHLTLEDLYHFETPHNITYTRLLPCFACSSFYQPPCMTCSGHGMTYRTVQIGPDMFTQRSLQCDYCQSTGRQNEHSCSQCSGRGTVKEECTESVKAEIWNGEEIRIKGAGDHKKGDLLV